MRRLSSCERLPRFLSEWVHGDWSQCWVWEKSVDSNGYAVVRIADTEWKVCELAYEWKFGSFPQNIELAHDCGNRACVNPEHLFVIPLLDANEPIDRRVDYRVVENPGLPSARTVTYEGKYGACVRFLADNYSNDEVLELDVKIEPCRP